MALRRVENTAISDDIPSLADLEAQYQKSIDDTVSLSDLEAQYQKTLPEPSYTDVIQKAWKVGKAQRRLGELRFSKKIGEEADEEMKDLRKSTQQETPRPGLGRKIAGATTEILPIMIKGMTEGQKLGLATGMTAGGVSAVTGPGAPVAVPAATGLGYMAGTAAGAAKYIYEVESGLSEEEFLEFRDEKGRGIDPQLAKDASLIAGGIKSLLEISQIGLIVKSIPGGKKLFGEVVNGLFKKAITNPTFLKSLAKITGSYAG